MKNLIREGDKAAILQRLQGVRHDSQRRWGKMSAHQMICHLSDSFKAAMGLKPVSPAGTILHRTLIKWVALQVPLRWPEGYKTRPEMDQEIGGTKPVEFARDLLELEQLVARFTERERDFEWQAHPAFGKMSEREWLRWGYLHMDHHLRQFGA